MIPQILTKGFGNGTFAGSINDITMVGFSSGVNIVTETARTNVVVRFDTTGQNVEGLIDEGPINVEGDIS